MGLSAFRTVLDKRLTTSNTAVVRDRAETNLWKPQPNTPQDLAFHHPADELLFGGSAGGGKAQACYGLNWAFQNTKLFTADSYHKIMSLVPQEIKDMDSKVLMWNGQWKGFSEVAVGDRIMNPDGQHQRIIQIHERGNKTIYRLTFEDGAIVECDGDHLWGFWEARTDSRSKTRFGKKPILDTGAPANWNFNYIARARTEDTNWLFLEVSKGKRFIVPINAPLNYTHLTRGNNKRAYLYGALIGDGSIQAKKGSGIRLCTSDDHIKERCLSLLSEKVWIRNNVKVVSIEESEDATQAPNNVDITFNDEWVKAWARNSGLLGKYSHEKFIPSGYLQESLEFRWSLAQGLFDTDGYASTAIKNEVSYCTVSFQLAEDVANLVRSLGYIAKIRQKQGVCYSLGYEGKKRMAYIVTVEGNDRWKLFSLPRKVKAAKSHEPNIWVGKRIVNVEKLGEVYTRCITVSNPNGLYITDGYTVTHNSALLLILATIAQRRSAIFRREYPRLKDIIEKSHTILDGVARYNSNDKIWRDIPGDRTLEFGAIQHLKNLEAWRGREHDFKGFDELTEFTRALYRFIITWCRSPMPNQRSRSVATSNPPTDKDGAWIIDYWAPWLRTDYPKPAKSAELRYFIVMGVDRVNEFIAQNKDAISITPRVETEVKERDIEVDVKQFRVTIAGIELTTDSPEPIEEKGLIYYPIANKIAFGKELLEPRSRSFIPATLDDNAYLRNTSYRGTLQALPEPLRSQLLYGDFSISIQDDNPWQVIPSAWVDAAVKRWTPQPPAPQSHLGVDVARGGSAETIIAPRHHHWLAPLITFPGTATPDGYLVADQIEVAFSNGQTELRIDLLGVGSSPYDIINRRNEGIHPMLRRKIIAMSGGRVSNLKDKSGRLGFANQRSAWWWHMRELLDPANDAILALPDDPKLIADLTAPRWRTISRKSADVIQVESKYDLAKEGLAKRLGRSPDRGDATVYAFAEVEPEESESNADWIDDL